MSVVESCPEREGDLPHVWAGACSSGDSSNPCRFCGTSGRDHFQRATAARSDLFANLGQPKSVTGWGKQS